MRLGRRAFAVAVVAAAVGACRSARTGGGVPPGAPPADPLRAYVGQRRILAGRGDTLRLSLKKGDLGRPASGCDVAVEVRSAAFKGGEAQLTLEALGSPHMAAGRGGPRCRQSGGQRSLRVTGFDRAASVADLTADLDRVLLTPEAYMASHGTRFTLAPVNQVTAAANDGPGATDAERRLFRQLTSQPRPLLAVDTTVHDPTGRVRQESEVEFNTLVGPDGRPRDSRLATPLSEAHEAQVLRALSLWRFEPARRGAEPVAARFSGRLVLRVF